MIHKYIARALGFKPFQTQGEEQRIIKDDTWHCPGTKEEEQLWFIAKNHAVHNNS